MSLSFNTPPREDKQQRASEILIHVKDTRIGAVTLIPTSTLSLSGILAKHLSGASTPFRFKIMSNKCLVGTSQLPLLVSRLVASVLCQFDGRFLVKSLFSLTRLRLCICACVYFHRKCTVITPPSCTMSQVAQLNFTARDSTSDPSDLTVQIGRRNRPSVNRPSERGHGCPGIIM